MYDFLHCDYHIVLIPTIIYRAPEKKYDAKINHTFSQYHIETP